MTQNPVTGKKFSPLHSLWIFLLFGSLGSLDYLSFSSPFLSQDISNQTLNISATIKEIQTLANGDRFLAHINSITDSSGNKISNRNIDLQLLTDGYSGKVGDIILFTTPLKPFTGNPSYADRMRHKGINYYANVKSEEINQVGNSSALAGRIKDFRDDIIILIEKSHLQHETGEFLISVLLGDKSFLKENIRDSLSSAGMAHILALSGMHVAIILGIILFLLYPLSLLGQHKTRKIVAIILMWAYVLLTGASPSTVRAAIMATLVIGAYLLQRQYSALNGLFAAGVLILLIDPFALWDIGMQLSFLCVGSIIIFVNKLNPVDHHAHPRLFKTLNLILVTIVTTFSTWVLISYYFGSVPLLFLPANFVLLPLLPFYLSIAFCYVVLLIMGVDFSVFSYVLDFFYENFIRLADNLSLNGNANLEFKAPGILVAVWLIGIVVLSFSLYSAIKKRKIILMFSGVGIIGLFFLISFLFESPEEGISLRFPHSFTAMEANFRQGDKSSILNFPRGSISEVCHNGVKITSVDQIILPDSLHILKNKGESLKHYLYLGSGIDNEQMALLISEGDFDKVILHSGIGKKKKAELLHLLDKSLWDKIYSLRENGSMEFSL